MLKKLRVFEMTNQSVLSQTLFYQTITFSYPCTVTLEQYLELCAHCPEGYEQSLTVTDKPTQFHFNNQAVLNAVLHSLPVIEPVLLFDDAIRPCKNCDVDGICTAKCLSQPCQPEGAPTCLPKKSTTTVCLAHTPLNLSTRIQSLNSITTQNSSRIAS